MQSHVLMHNTMHAYARICTTSPIECTFNPGFTVKVMRISKKNQSIKLDLVLKFSAYLLLIGLVQEFLVVKPVKVRSAYLGIPVMKLSLFESTKFARIALKLSGNKRIKFGA